MVVDDDRWLFRPRKRVRARVRLFCFPYAGGSPGMFRSWANALPETIDVVGVRLPGRERRLREPPFTEWPPLLDQVEHVLAPHLAELPFALFGHSLGARLAFELAMRLDRGTAGPGLLVISACRCPHVPPPRPELAEVSREELIAWIAAAGGAPRELLDNRELMDLLEPTLRADVRLAYAPWPHEQRQTRTPIATFIGADDPLDPPEAMAEWGRYTQELASSHTFAGDHFFIQSHESAVLAAVMHALEQRFGALA